MKNSIIVTILLISSYALKVHAQTNTICGYVLNEDLKPIPHAIIEVANSYIMVESKSDGFYSVIVPTSNNRIKVYAEGYKPLDIDIKEYVLVDVILVSNNIKKRHSEYVTIPQNIQPPKDTTLLAKLAFMHYEKQRYEDAFQLWYEGEKLGSALCLYNLGVLYYYGHGTEPDEQKALDCIKISALKGYHKAQMKLGDFYCNGLLVSCDTAKAVYWYGKSASQGNSDAKQRLESLSSYNINTQIDKKKCIAYIIGNYNYWKGNVLPHVREDVKALEKKFQSLGIYTRLCENLNRPEMLDSIDAFAKAARDYDLALFYYSGLSAQSKGTNYFIPVGKMEQSSETGILADCVKVDHLFECFSNYSIDSKIVILDACRDNSSIFGTKRSFSHIGLSHSTLNSYGTFVAYADQPNTIAEVSDNSMYSPFPYALAMTLSIPLLQINEVLALVQTIVDYETDGKQLPIYMNNLKDDRVILNTNVSHSK